MRMAPPPPLFEEEDQDQEMDQEMDLTDPPSPLHVEPEVAVVESRERSISPYPGSGR